MDPRRKKPDRQGEDIRQEAPAPESQDREAIESGAIAPGGVPQNGDPGYEIERSGGAPEEDGGIPYQNSDEAPPEDGDEAAIARGSSREGGRFDGM